MGNDWKETILGEVINFRRGHDLPKTKMEEGIYPVVGSNGIIGYHNEFTTKKPCISIGRSGNVGNPFYLNENCWLHNTTLYIDDFKGNNPEFIYYYLKTLNLQSFAGGSAVPTLNRNHIHPLQVRIPSVKVQKSIALILGSLDKKIDLNRQMNQTLEKIAQTLYKSWFVDFDPVIDNALESGNTIPGELTIRAKKRIELGEHRRPLPDNIKNLFPSEFVFCDELDKWIPKGWRVVDLEEIVTVKYGKDHKKLKEGHIPVYGSGGIMRYVVQSLYEGESVLIPRKGTLQNIMYVDEEFWSVDTMFFTIMKLDNIAKYIYYNLILLDFKNMNVGSAVPSMTTQVLNNLKILMPTEVVNCVFDQHIQLLLNKKKSNNQNIESLTKTRDILLPKLLSGEVDVSKFETIDTD